MPELSPLRLWSMRAAYLGLSLFIILCHLMPLELAPRGWVWEDGDTLPGIGAQPVYRTGWAAPDFLLALTFAWSLRRPEYVPPLAIAAVFLLSDFLFLKPPGLGAALVVSAALILQARSRGLRDQTFALEWFTMAITVIGLALATRMVAALFLLPQPGVELVAMQVIGTVLVYPVVVLLSFLVLQLRKSAPGDVERQGQRP